MPQSRHTHSHSRTGHGGLIGGLGPNVRTSSTTSLGNYKRATAGVAVGLGSTQVVHGGKEKNDVRFPPCHSTGLVIIVACELTSSSFFSGLCSPGETAC
jgi:hypothetical protein